MKSFYIRMKQCNEKYEIFYIDSNAFMRTADGCIHQSEEIHPEILKLEVNRH